MAAFSDFGGSGQRSNRQLQPLRLRAVAVSLKTLRQIIYLREGSGHGCRVVREHIAPPLGILAALNSGRPAGAHVPRSQAQSAPSGIDENAPPS